MSLRIRRGSRITTTPTYGPILGPPAIRASAGPRTVTTPGGAIAFTSRDDLSTKITANPATSTFVATGGPIFAWPASISGQGKNPTIVFPTTGSLILDGGRESASGTIAFDSSDRVTIKGGEFRNFSYGCVGNIVIEDANLHNR